MPGVSRPGSTPEAFYTFSPISLTHTFLEQMGRQSLELPNCSPRAELRSALERETRPCVGTWSQRHSLPLGSDSSLLMTAHSRTPREAVCLMRAEWLWVVLGTDVSGFLRHLMPPRGAVWRPGNLRGFSSMFANKSRQTSSLGALHVARTWTVHACQRGESTEENRGWFPVAP